jgi:cGMP-dependent protein kinase
VISSGGYFGEMALIYNSKRTATIRTLEKVVCWVLKGDKFRQAIQLVSSEKLQENKDFLKNFHFFNKLTDHQKDSLLSLLTVQEFSPGQRIVREQEKGSIIYIIKKGEVVVSIDGVQQRILGPGEYFGEQALIYKSLRTASVDAIGNVILLSLNSKELENLLGNELEYVIYKNSVRISIEKSHHISKLQKHQKEKIVEAVKIEHITENTKIIEKGEKNELVLILKGEIVVGKEKLGKFEMVGERDLFKQKTKKSKDLKSSSESVIARVTFDKIHEILGTSLKNSLKICKIFRILKKIQIFRNIPGGKLESLISKFSIEKFGMNKVIFEQGEIGEKFFIIKKGEVVVQVDGQFIREVVRHDYFGERSLVLSEARTATVISKSCTCWVLHKQDFLDIITTEARSLILKRIDLQNDSVTLKDLKLLKRLGKGTFGNVFVAFSTKSKLIYALKTVEREKIERYEIHKNLTQEKKIMLLLDHPFIVKLVKTFKDRLRVYFLMELVQGIDLFDLLRKFNSWEEEKTRFYSACLVLVLEHIHERGVIYRDLKPENVIIDHDGYPKVIDFGLAKIIQGRTYSVAGSSHYMAPEVIKGIGYGLEADCWSLGIIIYEILCNKVPWGEHEKDPMEVYNSIIKDKLVFPQYVQSPYTVKFIEKLLNRNPALRGKIENIKKDAWFSSVDFDELIEKNVKPPFKPCVEDYSKIVKSDVLKKQDFDKFIRKYEDCWKQMRKEELNYTWDFEF